MMPWGGHIPHLGNISTSKVEGAHAFIKRYIGASTGDFEFVMGSLKQAITQQIANVRTAIGREAQTRLLHYPPVFCKIGGLISHHALKLAKEQYELLKEGDPEPCSKTFSDSLGIPCQHQLDEIMTSNGYLELSDFHVQWHLKYDGTPQVSILIERKHGGKATWD